MTAKRPFDADGTVNMNMHKILKTGEVYLLLPARL